MQFMIAIILIYNMLLIIQYQHYPVNIIIFSFSTCCNYFCYYMKRPNPDETLSWDRLNHNENYSIICTLQLYVVLLLRCNAVYD